jgi:CRP/FNR family transcriptional regulator, dissimilatory nitrate respiration regulator
MASRYPRPTAESLARLAPFNLLPPDELERLAASAEIRAVAKNDIITHCGSQPDGMFLILEGEVKRFLLSPTGGEKIIQLAGAGDSFGEEAVLLNRPQQVSNQATRDTLLLHIGSAALRHAMAAHGALAAAMLGRMAERMYDLVENLQLCVQRNSTQRVAHYLAQLAPHEAQRCEIRLDTDKQTIASQLNLTPETLSRVLSRLTRDGMIRPHGRRGLTLTNVGGLRTCAAG